MNETDYQQRPEYDYIEGSEEYNARQQQVRMQYEIRKAKKSGRRQGFFISFGIFLFVLLVILVADIFIKIQSGSVFSLLGVLDGNKSIITKEVIGKADALKAALDMTYLEDVNDDDIREGIYKGIMAGVGDPYTVYYTKEEYDDMIEGAEGTFSGIGAYLQQDVDTMSIVVVRPMKDSPAEKVGLLADDIITEVNGENISGQDINLVVSKIRGEEGTSVNVGIYRPSEAKTLYFDIVRARVESETVSSEMLEDQIGYIMLSEFDDVSTNQFTSAIEELNAQGMKSLIVDLRDNPGGNVDVAVDIADYILPEGLVVYLEDKNGSREEYTSDASHHFDKPIVMLVNGNSASAAEILSGALKDYNRVTLIGNKTFGKGIVQSVLPLGDGSGVKITTAKYYFPSGKCIHGEGIEPDIEVDFDVDKYLEDGTDTQLEEAIRYLKEGK